MDVTESDTVAGTALRGGSRKSYDAFISYAHHADELFAPALQRGLQHLAKPWNRRRAMEVFRDDTSLAASPGLWPSIRTALDASRWFVLLASPEAVRSDWVGKEITHWVSNKGTDHLLVVVTDGTWIWDSESGDLSPTSTAANDAFRGVFPAEPKHLDMTWARRNEGMTTLRNARFRDQIATLAAAIREVPKEELEGEDVRQQRRTRRIVRAVIAALTVLVLLASVLAVVANIQRQQAVYQRDVAVSRLVINQGETLGDTDPALSKLESIAAWRINPSKEARYAMLAAAARPGIAILVGHIDRVQSVAFSPDGKTAASGSADGVRLWDVATRRQIGRPLTAPAASADELSGINSVVFSPDGKTLASGSDDHAVRLWDVATRRQIGQALWITKPPAGHTDAVTSVAFSPDGKTLASGSDDHAVRLWDVATRRQIGNALTGHTDGVSSVAFSPDGKTLASGSDDHAVRLWDVATRRQIGNALTGHTDGVSSVAFSPDGKTVASGGSGDGTVRLWDVATRRQIGSPLAPHTLGVASLAFSPDGKSLAIGGLDNTVRLWDVANRIGIAALTGHTDPVLGGGLQPGWQDRGQRRRR